MGVRATPSNEKERGHEYPPSVHRERQPCVCCRSRRTAPGGRAGAEEGREEGGEEGRVRVRRDRVADEEPASAGDREVQERAAGGAGDGGPGGEGEADGREVRFGG